MGLDFIMKLAGCRAALYPLRTEHITLGSAYNDTAVVTSLPTQSVHLSVCTSLTEHINQKHKIVQNYKKLI